MDGYIAWIVCIHSIYASILHIYPLYPPVHYLFIHRIYSSILSIHPFILSIYSINLFYQAGEKDKEGETEKREEREKRREREKQQQQQQQQRQASQTEQSTRFVHEFKNEFKWVDFSWRDPCPRPLSALSVDACLCKKESSNRNPKPKQ